MPCVNPSDFALWDGDKPQRHTQTHPHLGPVPIQRGWEAVLASLPLVSSPTGLSCGGLPIAPLFLPWCAWCEWCVNPGVRTGDLAPRHFPSDLPYSRVPQAPGSAMARARQEGSSPEPVEGLARDGPRPFPLGRLVPSAVSCGLCEPGLPAAPAAPALLPAAYLCAPTAPPAVTAALGGPRWPGGPRSRPRGPRPDGECPAHTRDDGSRGSEARSPQELQGERRGRGRAAHSGATARVWPVWSLCGE
jgi:hypothetical protein